MLETLSRDPPDRLARQTGSAIIPDPWETPSPTLKASSRSRSGSYCPKPQLLISPAKTPNTLHLLTPIAASDISSIQVLLEDGLKLRAYDGGKLTVQIRKALALLGWMGTITHTIA